MKKLFAILMVCFSVLIITGSIYAQPISGTKSIPGDYATIEAAIAALNTNGVGAGGVTFNVAAGHTETFSGPTVGTLTATGTLADQIIFQKSGGGANPLITAGIGTSTTTDGIIKIAGGDYITFDGISVQESAGNVTATTQMEWGYALVKKNAAAPFDGCQFVTIKNAAITLNKTNVNSAGIYTGNHIATATTALVITSTTDAMNNCKFYSNTISNVYLGIRLGGYAAATPFTLYDQDNEIGVGGGNSITNFAGAATTTYGIYVIYQNNIKVANNTVNGGAGQTTTFYGIFLSTGTNSSADIYGNTVTLTPSVTSSSIYGINSGIGTSGTNNTVNIYNNILENCSWNGATTSSILYGIYQTTTVFNVNMYGNIVRNNTKNGTGSTYCIYNSSGTASGNSAVYNNQVYGNNLTSTGSLYGVYISPGSTATSLIYGNTVYDNSSGGSIYGMYQNAGTTVNEYQNSVYNLTTTGSTGVAYGIYTATAANTYIYNNFISDLKATTSTSTNGVNGIYVSSGTNVGLYYNTIFFNAVSSSASTFGTSGIYAATASNLEMRNNIVVNKSTAGPTGSSFTVAYRRSSATLTTYANESNNNSLYAGVPSAANVIYYDGTTSYQRITDFKTLVAPRDAGSFTEDIHFVNGTTAPYDLHVDTTIATQTESGGTPVTTPVAVTTDYDGNTRNLTTPDVGADEFNGIAADLTAPSISYDLLTNTSLTTNRSVVGVSITDGSGVNTTAGTKPRIYFKRKTDNNTYVDNTSGTNGWKYTETTTLELPFNFTINYSLLFGGTGVALGDTVQYFVVAQDLAGTPNVGIYSGGFTNPPTSVALTAPAFPITGTINSYAIIAGIGGNLTVGTGGTYPSLTGAGGLFADINAKVVTGNILVQVLTDLTEDGTNALNQWIEDGTGNYTLTIQPLDASLKTISGSYAGGLIRLNGADRVIIDGRYSSSGNYLKFINTNTTGTIAAIQLTTLGTDLGATDNIIRNCIIAVGHHASGGTGISIGTGVAATGNSNHNNTVRDNIITNAYTGIYAGAAATGVNNGLIIAGNSIGGTAPGDTIALKGINVLGANAPEISGNDIFGMSNFTSTANAGIELGTNVTNAFVSKNKIHNLRQTYTSGAGCYGIVISSGTGNSGNTIVNNMIYDILTVGDGTSTATNAFGIRIVGGTGHKVYYNSVNMYGAHMGPGAAADISAALIITVNSVTGTDIRNNIFANSITGINVGTKSYAIYAVTGTTFGTINRNVYRATGTYGVLGFLGTEKATLAAWKGATGQDLNSYNVDPQFTNNADLHINSGLTATVLESGGDVIAGITTDIDGHVRPGPAGSVNGGATAPDIGVDEFDGVPAVPMVYVSSTVTQNNTAGLIKNTANNEILGIQIVVTGAANAFTVQSLDFNTTGTTSLSDIWNAKVWYTGTSPVFAAAAQFGTTFNPITSTFTITGNIPLVEGTNYFWLSFDVVASPTGNNLVDAQCTGFTMDEASYTPAVTNPAGNRTILPALAGSYTIGTGGSFVTITEAVNALNVLGVSAPVTFNLTNANYSSAETFPIVINQADGVSSTNTVTFKPAALNSATISGSATSIIKLNGADYIIFDGSNSGGTDRNLTIQNTATSSSTTVIWVSSLGTDLGAANNTIKNCKVIAGSKTVTSMFGVFVGGTSISTTGTGASNHNLTVQNNTISGAYYGVYARGVATTGVNTGLTITKNIIGNDVVDNSIGKYGLDINQADGASISQNMIYNFVGTATNPTGMLLGTGFVNGSVLANEIYELMYTGSTGYGGKGIDINTGSTASNVLIANNVIHDLKGDGYTSLTGDAIVGIRILGTTGGLNIYYNSINLSGTTDRSTANLSAALYIVATAAALDIRDNIFSNSILNNLNGGSKAYAVYDAGTNGVFTTINYNDYYASGIQGVLGYLSADVTTIEAWRTATAQDVNSFVADPIFNSNSNLRPQPGSPVLAVGTPIAGITVDFMGVTRNALNPSVGAYETGADAIGPSISYTPLINTSSLANRTLSGVDINDPSGVNVTTFKPRIYYKKSTNANVFGGNTSTDNGWKWTETAQTATPFSFLIDYSKLFGGVPVLADTIQYFVAAQDVNNAVSAVPSAGFTAVSVANVTTAPTTPYAYKITNIALAGDYTVGLSEFNRINGRNFTIETRTRKVKVEVPVVEEIEGGLTGIKETDLISTGIKNEDAVSSRVNGEELSVNIGKDIPVASSEDNVIEKITRYTTIEVEEEYPVLVENGKIFEWKSYEERKADGFVEGVYSTIADAVADVNERGVSAPVRFLLTDASYTEAYPIIIGDIPNASATNTVTFKPQTGVSPLISAASATTAMFNLNGAKYVIFDGSNTNGGTTRDMTMTNASSSVPVFRLENGAAYNTIKNIVFNAQNTSTSSGVIAILSAAIVGNTNNTIQNNRFNDNGGTKSAYHIYSSGLTSEPNSNTTITGNEFNNFSSSGIRGTTGSGNSWLINNNHFFSVLSAGTALTPINFTPGIGSGSHTISGNYIGGTALNAGGDPLVVTTASSFAGMAISVDTTNVSTIQNNYIKNINLQNTGSHTFYGMNVTGGTLSILNNVIGDSAAANSILAAGSSTTTGIRIDATNYTNTFTVSGNIVANLNATGTGTGVRVRGMFHDFAECKTSYLNNIIRNLSTQSTGAGIGAGSQAAVGMYIYGGDYDVTPLIISGNTIFNISADNNSAVSTISAGMFGTNFDAYFNGNKIYNVTNASTQTTPDVPAIAAGIFFRYTGGINAVTNNMISIGSGQTNGASYIGIINVIGAAGNTLRLYHNTVNLEGTVASDGLNTYCFQRGYNDTTSLETDIDIKNNIFTNQRSGGTGKHYVLHNRFTQTGWDTSACDYNVLNSSSPATIGAWLGTDYNFTGWQAASAGDSSSYSGETVTFVNSPAGNLHLNMGTTPTVLESHGTTIAGLDFDFDNDVRPGPAGSINGGATAPDLGADEFDGVPTGAATFPLTVIVANGWNMVSIPGLLPTNQNVTTWWPGKDPSAGVFKFQGGYQTVTVATPGVGYWMKNVGAQTYNTGDEWPAGINFVAHDPIPGALGWNMFGGYEQTVATAGLTTTPPGLITGNVFKYANGYLIATQLDPGYGYWIKLTGAGSINIPSALAGPTKVVAGTSTEGFGKIIITDNTQNSYTLYASKGKADLTQFDLPPYPPQGMFDVRYSSQRFAENLGTQQTIEMTGVQYPVKVKADGVGIILSDETGKEIARLKTGEEITLNTSVSKLMVTENVIPAVYALEQNYPNPFNPSTTIQFSIPEDVQNVKLIIYSALGEKVAELVNTGLQAGIYKYRWNASDIASGLYIYQIVTEKFVQTKKMMLLK